MIGTVFGSRYEILQQVGCGGMAIVYKAKDRLLNRFVAVKVLRSEFKDDEEFIHRFNIESQSAASLSHPNIITIYDVGEQGGEHYIVMEYLEGKTLKEYIHDFGALYWKEATDFSMQICSALEHAHSKHIIHRDIKPQNIIMTENRQLKVSDFGIARAANKVTTNMETAALGSAHYLSPEQARGGYTDERSDIYSLGVVMYELFTGCLPFDGETSVAVAMQHIQRTPVAPRKINPKIPESIENIILKAMSKEQRLRYKNATEMLEDIRKVYMDPDTVISPPEQPGGEDVGGTKRIGVIPDLVRPQPPSPVRKSDGAKENENRKTAPKKSRKEDIIAVSAAIITSLVLFGIIGFFVVRTLFPTDAAAEISVPDLYDLTVSEAEDKLKGTNLTVIVAKEDYDDEVEEGHIIAQDPKAEDKVRPPREISLTLSRGPKTFELKDYTGKDYRDIQQDLSYNHDINVIIQNEESATVPSGIVIRQSPLEGAVLKAGDNLTLYVSEGIATTTVPHLVGETEANARILIERNHLKVNVTYTQSDEVKGKVLSQEPGAGLTVDAQSEVSISVSKGAVTAETEPSSGAAEKTVKYLTVNLPSDREKVTVKLICDGAVIYEKSHETKDKTASISIKGSGTVKVDIYLDNGFIATKEVKFN